LQTLALHWLSSNSTCTVSAKSEQNTAKNRLQEFNITRWGMTRKGGSVVRGIRRSGVFVAGESTRQTWVYKQKSDLEHSV